MKLHESKKRASSYDVWDALFCVAMTLAMAAVFALGMAAGG